MKFDRAIFAGVFFLCLTGGGASANDRQLCLEDTLRGDLDPVYAACSKLLAATFVKPALQAKYHWRKAEILYRQHQFKEALEAIELSLILAPDFPPALMRRAYVLSHLGRRDKAFAAAEQLVAAAPEWSNSPLTLAFLGVFHLTFEQRFHAFSRSLALDPDNYIARNGFASFLVAIGMIKEGEAQWQTVLDADREAVDAHFHFTIGSDEFELYGLVLETRGSYFSANQQSDKALADFTRLIELHPLKARGYYFRARQFLLAKQLDLAEADIAKALELLPDYTKALEVRVQINFKRKQYEQVVRDTDVLLAGETEERAVLESLRGAALRYLNRPKEAFESFLQSAKLEPLFANDRKYRMKRQGYYSGTTEKFLEDEKFLNGLMACAIDPDC